MKGVIIALGRPQAARPELQCANTLFFCKAWSAQPHRTWLDDSGSVTQMERVLTFDGFRQGRRERGNGKDKENVGLWVHRYEKSPESLRSTFYAGLPTSRCTGSN